MGEKKERTRGEVGEREVERALDCPRGKNNYLRLKININCIFHLFGERSSKKTAFCFPCQIEKGQQFFEEIEFVLFVSNLVDKQNKTKQKTQGRQKWPKILNWFFFHPPPPPLSSFPYHHTTTRPPTTPTTPPTAQTWFGSPCHRRDRILLCCSQKQKRITYH